MKKLILILAVNFIAFQSFSLPTLSTLDRLRLEIDGKTILGISDKVFINAQNTFKSNIYNLINDLGTIKKNASIILNRPELMVPECPCGEQVITISASYLDDIALKYDILNSVLLPIDHEYYKIN